MFEHLRRRLESQIAGAQSDAAAARADRDAAQARAAELAAALVQLEDDLARAREAARWAADALAAADALVGHQVQQRGGAQAALDAAERALQDLLNGEPPDEINGKPNPQHEKWEQRVASQQEVVAAARAARDAAQNALAHAQQGRDAAAATATAANEAVTQAEARIAAAHAEVAVARDTAARVAATVEERERLVADLTAQAGALDARAARLTAQPLDRADLERAADAELADLLAMRALRRQLLEQRAGLSAQRGAVLADQDAVVDQVQTLRAAIAAWPDSAHYPELPALLAALDGVVAASAAQRGRPPHERADDSRRRRPSSRRRPRRCRASPSGPPPSATPRACARTRPPPTSPSTRRRPRDAPARLRG